MENNIIFEQILEAFLANDDLVGIFVANEKPSCLMKSQRINLNLTRRYF